VTSSHWNGGGERAGVRGSCRGGKAAAGAGFSPYSPRRLPGGSPAAIRALPSADARAGTMEDMGPTRGAQSQSRRLKMTYRLVQTTAIRTIAKG
jgi:hypothetical protein